ncbi:phosphotransferase enzyme family-domain-containing protein [Ampelomyces quisqualis]|uniref:Phosphotransferase enzyme family-domain-containing protein n=1 Tax=Ampelomyces quisqualis TaxID=50730 RepID=A0A6A5Q981_AMPQU|nr:phosphotransferase enzyme family-domain-containing protein [Ampelomyces quisqualis]
MRDSVVQSGAIPVQDSDAISETSTTRLEHEPFETLRHRAVELVAKILGRHPSRIEAQRLKGGTFNRVISLTYVPLRRKKFTSQWVKAQFCGLFGRTKEPKPQSYVLRMPWHENDELKRDVAVLNAVGSRLALPVPEVITFDASDDNVVRRQFMLQKRLRGDNLAHTPMLENLNTAQRKSLAKAVIEMVTHIASVTGPPGNLSVDNLNLGKRGKVQVEKLCVPRRDQEDRDIFDHPCTWPAQEQKPLDHLLEQCERWREFQNAEGFCTEAVWSGFAAISKALEKRGFLDGPNVLSHGDLKPYNLLAETRSETEVEITGVLDWDSAAIAPEFMAYRAPFWLWTPEDVNSVHEDDEENANIEPDNAEHRELKDLFLAHASEKFKLFAFAPEAMLARRMYFILKEGIFGPWNMMEANKVIEEWNELHPEDGVVIDVDFSDDGSVESE